MTSETYGFEGFGEHFGNESFWGAVGSAGRRLGWRALEKVLLAYYVGTDSETPAWAKSALLGALGYFVLPMDAVPDAIPVVGYSDDMSVLGVALAAVVTCTTDEHVRAARNCGRRWGFVRDCDPGDSGANA